MRDLQIILRILNRISETILEIFGNVLDRNMGKSTLSHQRLRKNFMNTVFITVFPNDRKKND